MDEVEIVKCPDCGREVPRSNMVVHQARCNQSRFRARTNTGLPDEGSSDENSPPRSRMRLSHQSVSPPSSLSRGELPTTLISRSHPISLTQSPAVASMPRSDSTEAMDVNNHSPSLGLRRRRVRGVVDNEESSSGAKTNGLEDENEIQEVHVVDLAGDDDDDDDDDNDSDSIEAEWACPRCTLLNPLGNDICEACQYHYRNVASTSTENERDIRRPDSVRREALISDAELRRDDVNTLLRQLLTDSSRENDISRNHDDSNGENRHLFRSIGGSAILGSGIAAASAYMRGGNIRESALQGALVGAVGSAFSNVANSPSPHISSSRLPPVQRTYRTSMGTIRVMQRPWSVMSRNAGMTDAIDNMSYDRLLEVFGDGSENRGADMSTIQNLPSVNLKDVEKELPEDQRQCAICLESFQNGQVRRSLPCLHGFHEECVDRWLQSNAVCPICKHHI